MPTEDISKTAVYAAAGAAAAGVALGAMNKSKKNASADAHSKVTINDLEK